jgi:hypothetical protein
MLNAGGNCKLSGSDHTVFNQCQRSEEVKREGKASQLPEIAEVAHTKTIF